MNSFKIGTTEFGIGKYEFSIDSGIMNIEIVGDEETFNKITENEDSEWNWALYAPKIYFSNVPYEGEKIIADDDLYEKCDFALYMMQYNDFWGEVEVIDNVLHITGKADIMGEMYPVSIELNVLE